MIWEKLMTQIALRNCCRSSFSEITIFQFTLDIQRQFLGSRKCIAKNQEKFLFSTEWSIKSSFSFTKYIFDEDEKALSQHLFFSQKREGDSFLVFRANEGEVIEGQLGGYRHHQVRS